MGSTSGAVLRNCIVYVSNFVSEIRRARAKFEPFVEGLTSLQQNIRFHHGAAVVKISNGITIKPRHRRRTKFPSPASVACERCLRHPTPTTTIATQP